MKRLFVPLWYPPEQNYAGGFYRAKRIIESFQGYEPYVAASDTFPLEDAHVLRYPTRALRSDLPIPLWFKLVRVLNWAWSAIAATTLAFVWRKKYDATYAGPSEILPISLAGLIVGKLCRIPVILCNQNVRDTELWALNRVVHSSADAIITVSEALADELRSQQIKTPVFVGTNGVDDFSLPRRKSEYDGIFVGRHTEAKGIFDLLKAWRFICDARPESRLVCAGSITPKVSATIQRLLTNLRLRESVVLCGPVDEEKKWDLFAVSRVCVFPSYVEGWGIVPLEAHLAGLPVVAYDLPAYSATIARSPGAALTPCGDVEAFAQAVLNRLSQPDADASQLHDWASTFTWGAAAQTEERIIDGILGS